MPISIKKNRRVFDESGTDYIIGDLIFALHNSAKVYGLINRLDKVYVEITDINANRHALNRMSDISLDKAGTEKLFWPEKLVKGENDSGFTGFISNNPYITGNLVSLGEIIEGRKKKNFLTQEEKEYYLNLGIQLAECIEKIHECKYVVGILSPDKFEVSQAGVLYSCSTYKFAYEKVDPFENPYYVTPEWLNKMNRESIIFDQKSDSFLYAIILFQLLTGKYPFLTERDISEIGNEELWEQMVDGKSLYFWEDTNVMKTVETELMGLPSEIGSLFKRTFDYCGCENYYEARPSITEWISILK